MRLKETLISIAKKTNNFRESIVNQSNIKWIGNSNSYNDFIRIFNNNEINEHSILKFLRTQEGNFSFLIENEKLIYFAVDIISSYPIFYTKTKKSIKISNSAKELKKVLKSEKICDDSLVEFYLSSYISGSKTIFKNLKKIEPGQLAIYNKSSNSLIKKSYFDYSPKTKVRLTNDINKHFENLDKIIDKIFSKIIKESKNRTIWVPLSGGLDSRFILSKLVSLGCTNLYSFSYGPKGNYEAQQAKKVSSILNVPWIFVKTGSRQARNLYLSKERNRYWDFSSGYYSLPSMMEFEAIYKLKTKNILDKDSIIINGQTGDFVTGGHIPLIFKDIIKSEDLVKFIIKKHYSVWKSDLTLISTEIIKNKIFKYLNLKKNQVLSLNEFASLFEKWEWYSRQSMSISGGQKLYDFYGYSWRLPFWDINLVNFFMNLPIELRKNQSLFKAYLKNYNYKNLFLNYESESRRWKIGQLLFLRPISFILKILGFNNQKLYQYFSYWSHYHNQYSFYGIKFFFKHIGKAVVPPEARGVIALGVQAWLEENELIDKIKTGKINS